MALTKSAGRTRMRRRLNDTTATYEYSDTHVDTLLHPAIKEIAVAVRSVSPDHFLRHATILGYTQALDPGPGSGEQAFEFYAAPQNMSAFRWAERMTAAGAVQYRLREVSPREQEGHRHANSLGWTRVGVRNAGSTDYYDLGASTGSETISLQNNRFRIVRPPTSEVTYRIWFDAEPALPSGESEPIDVPEAFEEALIRAWARSVLEDGGDAAMAAAQEKALAREMGNAKAAFGKRAGRSRSLGPVW